MQRVNSANKSGECFALGLGLEHEAVIDWPGWELQHTVNVFVLFENLVRVHFTHLTPFLHHLHILQQGDVACGFRVSQRTLDHALESHEILHSSLNKSTDVCLHRQHLSWGLACVLQVVTARNLLLVSYAWLARQDSLFSSLWGIQHQIRLGC